MNPHFPVYDCYEELEVSRRASPEVIKAAHRALTLKHHPDKGAGSSEKRMQRINAAYDILKDPEVREAYDLHLASSSAHSEGHDGSSGGSQTRQRQERAGGKTSGPRRGQLTCPLCGKSFRTPGGLRWHEQNIRH